MGQYRKRKPMKLMKILFVFVLLLAGHHSWAQEAQEAQEDESTQESEQEQQLPKASSVLSEQKFQGFNLEGYTQSGEKSWEVKGESADIDGSQIKVNNVDANAYGEQKMNVTAETGMIDQATGKMRLEKDVVITSDQGSQLMTDSLDWDRNEDLVTTQDDVFIKDNRFTAMGKGMQPKP